MKSSTAQPVSSLINSLGSLFVPKKIESKDPPPPPPLIADELQQMRIEERLEICRELFSDNTKLITEGNNFKTYQPSYLKNNQQFNERAAKAITFTPHKKAPDRFEFTPIPPQVPGVFKSLCALYDIYQEIIAAKGAGSTSRTIESLLAHYRLPLSEREFAGVRQAFDESLQHIDIYNKIKFVPITTLKVMAEIKQKTLFKY